MIWGALVDVTSNGASTLTHLHPNLRFISMQHFTHATDGGVQYGSQVDRDIASLFAMPYRVQFNVPEP